jgi:hypothetical protein
MAKGVVGFASSYSKALLMLAVSLIVLWFLLNWLHNQFSSNIIGQTAGNVGSLATGSKYQF